jgi:hypothetical protein
VRVAVGLGAGVTALSGRGDVSLTAGAAVSGGRVATVSAPDIVVVSLPGTEPDRRSPPQPLSIVEESEQTTQSWTLQPRIIGSTLSLGAAGSDTQRSFLSAEC